MTGPDNANESQTYMENTNDTPNNTEQSASRDSVHAAVRIFRRKQYRAMSKQWLEHLPTGSELMEDPLRKAYEAGCAAMQAKLDFFYREASALNPAASEHYRMVAIIPNAASDLSRHE